MKRAAILIDRRSPVPLHRQLEAAFRNAILSGTLSPGERVLSSRELQTHLGVSRNTIMDALDQLHAEGYLVTLRGVGTFVASAVQKRSQAPAVATSGSTVVPSSSAAAFLDAHALAANLEETAPFRPGVPALDLFPAAQFKRGFEPSCWTPRVLDYANAFGYEPLREAIARRLQQTRGIACSPEHILIAGGAQSAFSLIVRVLLNGKDAAVVEEPGYSSIRAILLAHGARLITAPVDGSGVDVASFQKRRAKLAYVTPSHQYPTGAVLSLERRFALLDWAEKHDAWIVEDDYDSEFNYTDHTHPALQGLGDGRRVIYVGTFSKVLAPALRMAYLVVPQSLRSAFEAAQQVTSGTPSTMLQSALASFMNDGYLGRHIVKMRRIYDERRRFVSETLRGAGGATFRIRDNRAGLHFIAELPATIHDAGFAKRAEANGIIVPPLSSYFHEKPALNGIVIGYAATALPAAKKAVETLADLADSALR